MNMENIYLENREMHGVGGGGGGGEGLRTCCIKKVKKRDGNGQVAS